MNQTLSGPYNVPGLSAIDLSGLRNSQHPFEGGMDIRITPASGGVIVSILRGDFGRTPDLYVISEEQELGVELGKIITMACLKQK